MKSFVNRSGLRLEYETIGEGRPFVFLHGLGGTHGQLLGFHKPLAGVRYILPDQQGHGRSEADFDRLDMDVMADDVIELLDRLKVEKAVFAGISMGAAVSLNAAVRHPERVEKLLLIRNAWVAEPIDEKIRLAYRDLAKALEHDDREMFVRSRGYRVIEESGSDYTRNAFMLPFGQEYNRRYCRKYVVFPGLTPVRSEKEIEGLGMPVYIAACRGDLCHPYEYGERIHELVEGSVFYEIPNKDEDPEEHGRLLNRIIAEVLE